MHPYPVLEQNNIYRMQEQMLLLMLRFVACRWLEHHKEDQYHKLHRVYYQ